MPKFVTPSSCSFRIFFFSSRRRHTRFSRDWSSDVCSSDLGEDGHSREPRAEVKQLARSTEARSQQRTGEQHRERLEGEGHRRPHDRHGQSGSERRQNGKADDTHDAGDTRGGKDVQPLRDSAGATLHAFCSSSGWWILCPSTVFAHSRSTERATALPPPRQRVASPVDRPRSSSAWMSVVRTRAPDAPIGWPSATAPPCTLTRSQSHPSSCPSASA